MSANVPVPAGPAPSLVTLTHVIYGLHSLSILIGITSVVTIVGAFVFGWPSIVAVILNYMKRSEARGTWLESHFRWQIRTFWFSLLWIVIGTVLVITVLGIPLAVVLFAGTGIWVVYRIIRGWLALNDRRAIAPLPDEATRGSA